MKNQAAAFLMIFCAIILCPFSAFSDVYSNSESAMSVYVLALKGRPKPQARSYILFDHIDNCFFMSLPYFGENKVEFVAGLWEMQGDSIVVLTPNVIIEPTGKGIKCKDFKYKYSETVAPFLSSFKFKVYDDTLKMTDYIGQRREEPWSFRFNVYTLVHGVSLKLRKKEKSL